MSPRPTRVSASRARSLLVIDWDDGHHSEYPFSALRAACPCAECRARQAEPHPSDPPDSTVIPLLPQGTNDLTEMHQTGNYALQLVWRDGHRTGIYPWEYLRRLCPCEDHRSGRLT